MAATAVEQLLLLAVTDIEGSGLGNWAAAHAATVTLDPSAASCPIVVQSHGAFDGARMCVPAAALARAGTHTWLLNAAMARPSSADGAAGANPGGLYALKCLDAAAADRLAALLAHGETRGGAGGSWFDQKTDKASAQLYFSYYGMLQHQQNMLQDYVRTGTYQYAITENRADFEGRTVMDVGAGSAILSLFSAQAGAAKVYAVEASDMAGHAAALAAANGPLGAVIQLVHSKLEEVSLPERVDVLVSEPMGTLLVNERMLETYIYARNHFLKPGGKMFPQIGRIHAAAFSDPTLYAEIYNKASFWQQSNFYGVNINALHQPAMEGFFAQVVVDAFEASLLVSNCATRVLDFGTVEEEELHDIRIPLNLTVVAPCTVHGLACWFDVLFAGSQRPVWLSTAPGQPTTHWFQLRCVLQTPLVAALPGTQLTGELRLKAHARQSYDISLTLSGPPLGPGLPPQESSGTYDLKEPYYRQLNSGWGQQAALAASLQATDALQPGVYAAAPASSSGEPQV